jgi:hypothetical protein
MISRMWRLVMLVLLLFCDVVYAQERLGSEGIAAFRAGDAAKAVTLLSADMQRAPLPTIAIWHARAVVRLGHLIDAEKRYAAVVAQKDDELARLVANSESLGVDGLDEQKKTRTQAQLELEQVRERIPTLTVSVPPGATVMLNGGPFDPATTPQFDPGSYEIVGTHNGQTVVRAIVLNERDRVMVGLRFEPPRAVDDPGAGQRTTGWVLLGVGAAGVVVGSIIGIIAITKLEAADCPDDMCPPEKFEDADDYNALREPSGVSIIAGGLLAAAGIGLLISAPSAHATESTMSAYIGPGFAGLRGSF